MARTKGSKNKISIHLPDVCGLTTEQRLELIANLMIERIIDDQTNGQQLLNQIGGGHGYRKPATA